MAGAGYRELRPPPALASRVACLWWRRPGSGSGSGSGADSGSGSGARQVVLPDGCVDLVWHDGALVVAGPDTGPAPSSPTARVTVGVRFRPGAAADVLGEAAGALRDQRVPVEAIWGTAGRELAERVADAEDDRRRLALLLGTIAARPATHDPVDPAVAEAVALLTTGGIGVARLATTVALSERQLRRRFVEHVGYGPKTLDRVLRLQRFLAQAGRGARLAEVAIVAGYADQAHLSREARSLTGSSPLDLWGRWAPAPSSAEAEGRHRRGAPSTTSETDKIGARRSVTIGA